jgi:uncharacterized protein
MKSRSSTISSASAVMSAEARVAAYNWQVFAGELDNYGCAVLPKLLSPGECRTIAALYSDESHFRSHIHMARHGFGWETTSAIPTTTRRFKQCHGGGQTRPTPLLLQYVPGDFNCLHQDLYGDFAFPIQVAILLSEPGKDFTGGEFVLTE